MIQELLSYETPGPLNGGPPWPGQGQALVLGESQTLHTLLPGSCSVAGHELDRPALYLGRPGEGWAPGQDATFFPLSQTAASQENLILCPPDDLSSSLSLSLSVSLSLSASLFLPLYKQVQTATVRGGHAVGAGSFLVRGRGLHVPADDGETQHL